ncbi:MAG: hypothetical protein HGA76_03700, partial [Candidatus Firestonebacteria bacterium]|nr:hypothetical protein [Candidatus Firestonebacteria bacterium]
PDHFLLEPLKLALLGHRDRAVHHEAEVIPLELLPEDTNAQNMIAAANQKLSAEKLSADSSKNHQLIDQYFQQGLQNLRAGHYDEAMNAWKKILSLEPGNSRVTQYLRLTQTKLNDLVEELLRLAEQNWESGQSVEAVKKWRQILDLAPAQPTARAWLESNKAKLADLADQFYRQGVQFYIQNDLDEALTAWQNVLIVDPANKKALDHVEQVKRKRKELNALK